MNHLDLDYQTLLQDILSNGTRKQTRNGEVLSVFGRQIRHKMQDGFPLLTTKKMYFKGIVTELLWFLRGDTNIKFLVDNGCHIWGGDAYKRYWFNWRPMLEDCGENLTPHTQEEFIERIKTDTEFAKKWGDLGPVYGKQWRSWGYDSDKWREEYKKLQFGSKEEIEHLGKKGIDQIANLINELKTNPDSRRLMVSAWNVGEIDQMTLPPCHYNWQCYVREGKYLSLMWNQRSVDTFLGLPFNIASYGLLLEIIAKEVNMVPDELIGNLGDTHLYLNHVEQAWEQIGREPYTLPTLKIEDEVKWSEGDCLPYYSPSDFTIENYRSYPTIKAPLSN
jgi:thymidylate synthase